MTADRIRACLAPTRAGVSTETRACTKVRGQSSPTRRVGRGRAMRSRRGRTRAQGFERLNRYARLEAFSNSRHFPVYSRSAELRNRALRTTGGTPSRSAKLIGGTWHASERGSTSSAAIPKTSYFRPAASLRTGAASGLAKSCTTVSRCAPKSRDDVRRWRLRSGSYASLDLRKRMCDRRDQHENHAREARQDAGKSGSTSL